MLKLFKRRSKLEKLQDEFSTLMSEWHRLSSINRSESDKKFAEAQNIAKKIETLKKHNLEIN